MFLCLPWRFNYPDRFLATIRIVFLVYDKLQMKTLTLQLCNLWEILLAKRLDSKCDMKRVNDNPLNLWNKLYLWKTLPSPVPWDIHIWNKHCCATAYGLNYMVKVNKSPKKTDMILSATVCPSNTFYGLLQVISIHNFQSCDIST